MTTEGEIEKIENPPGVLVFLKWHKTNFKEYAWKENENKYK